MAVVNQPHPRATPSDSVCLLPRIFGTLCYNYNIIGCRILKKIHAGKVTEDNTNLQQQPTATPHKVLWQPKLE